MSMSSYERVYRAIHFQTPDRLPISMGEMGIDDLGWVGPRFGSEKGLTGVGPDEWGCIWSRTEMANMGQVTGHPMEDWSKLANYPFPDPDNPRIYAHLDEQLDQQAGKYIQFGIFMLLFERMHSLHGFANILEDLYLEPELCAELADKIVDIQIRMIRNAAEVAKGRIHCLQFTDDWGTQQACFISLPMWREFFKPRYKQIFDVVHSVGWDVVMHSCGKVNDVIEELIEIGADVMNLEQPRALGIEEIGRRYAGRIAFFSLCDIQSTLPFKSDAEIREEAKLLLDCWGTPQGGFILTDYGDPEAIGAPRDKKQVMFDAFLEYDRWKKAAV